MSAMSNWLASFVLNAAWQIAAITLIAVLSARLLRGAPSRYVHAIWVIALAASLAVPLISLVVEVRDAREVATNTVPGHAIEASRSMEKRIPVSFHSFSRPIAFPAPFVRVLVGAYIILLLLRVTQFSWAAYRTVRVRRRAFARAIPLRLSRAAELCWRRFTGRQVPILCTLDAHGPATIGTVRPVLVLPENFFDDSFEEADLICALSHEFAHIGRRDFLMNFIYEMAYVPICFQPCAAFIMARIAQTRELACDEMAATMSPSPRHYAQSLLQIARSVLSCPRQNGNYALGLFDTNALEERIMNVLARTKSNSEWTRTKKYAAVCLLAAACLALSAFSFRVAPGLNGAELDRFAGTWETKYNGKVFFTIKLGVENGALHGTCTHSVRLAYVDGELIPVEDKMETEGIAEVQVSGQKLLLKVGDSRTEDTVPLEFTLSGNGRADVRILVESPSGTPAPKKPWHFERVNTGR
jgi:beta-lactamase regulating signal transducer with metallopeptidase domain